MLYTVYLSIYICYRSPNKASSWSYVHPLSHLANELGRHPVPRFTSDLLPGLPQVGQHRLSGLQWCGGLSGHETLLRGGVPMAHSLAKDRPR